MGWGYASEMGCGQWLQSNDTSKIRLRSDVILSDTPTCPQFGIRQFFRLFDQLLAVALDFLQPFHFTKETGIRNIIARNSGPT